MARLVLRLDKLQQLRQQHGDLENDQDLAYAIGVHPTQVSRVLRGASAGNKFVAGLALVFGKEALLELFDVEPDNGAAA